MVQRLEINKGSKVLVGLTGTFGSGKSTVAHLFEELGAFLIDADSLAHEALFEGSACYSEITKVFGQDLVLADGKIDRGSLAKVIFKSSEARKKLESIIHPYVFKRIAEEITAADQNIIVMEVPLLYEVGLNELCDHVVVVSCSEGTVKQRLKEKGFSEDEIIKRQAAQMKLSEKIKKADHVIDNDPNGMESLKKNVQLVWEKILPPLKGAQ